MSTARHLRRTHNPNIDAGPLVQYVELRMQADGYGMNDLVGDNIPLRLRYHDGAFEAYIGQSYRTFSRIKERGTIRFYKADAICTCLGVHMADVYGMSAYMGFFDEAEEREEVMT